MIICSAGDGADCRNNPPGVGKSASLELVDRPDDLSFSMRCLFDGMSGEFFFPGGVVIERFGGRGSQRARGPSPA